MIDPARLEDTDTLTLLQPVMDPPSKTESGASNTVATPLNVNAATDIMQFQLQSCNTNGLAPAYSVLLSDDLGTDLTAQLDEASIANLAVTINGAAAIAGVDYTFIPPAIRGGNLHRLWTKPDLEQ